MTSKLDETCVEFWDTSDLILGMDYKWYGSVLRRSEDGIHVFATLKNLAKFIDLSGNRSE